MYYIYMICKKQAIFRTSPFLDPLTSMMTSRRGLDVSAKEELPTNLRGKPTRTSDIWGFWDDLHCMYCKMICYDMS